MSMSKAQVSSPEMSKADEFRQVDRGVLVQDGSKEQAGRGAPQADADALPQVAVRQNVDARCGPGCQSEKAKQALISEASTDRRRALTSRAGRAGAGAAPLRQKIIGRLPIPVDGRYPNLVQKPIIQKYA